ncbi:MAG: DUF6444 domain-containing protein [Caldilineaceae bacterium]|nr:DUF6444 domain-containing protein [Caldilineaceae bacterium]
MPSSALSCEPAALREQVAMLVEKSALPEEQVRQLQEEIQDLRRQVRRDSSNSGQPPLQDGPGCRRRRRSLHRGTGCRPGGQPGHRGLTHHQVAPCQVDTHVPIH